MSDLPSRQPRGDRRAHEKRDLLSRRQRPDTRYRNLAGVENAVGVRIEVDVRRRWNEIAWSRVRYREIERVLGVSRVSQPEREGRRSAGERVHDRSGIGGRAVRNDEGAVGGEHVHRNRVREGGEQGAAPLVDRLRSARNDLSGGGRLSRRAGREQGEPRNQKREKELPFSRSYGRRSAHPVASRNRTRGRSLRGIRPPVRRFHAWYAG